MRRLFLASIIAAAGALPFFTGCSATVEPEGYGYGNAYPAGGYYYAGNDYAYNGYYDRYPHYYHGRNVYRQDDARFGRGREIERRSPVVERRGTEIRGGTVVHGEVGVGGRGRVYSSDR